MLQFEFSVRTGEGRPTEDDEAEVAEIERDEPCCQSCANEWWYAWLYLLRVTVALGVTFALVHFPSVAFLQKFMLTGAVVPWWRISPFLLPVDVLFFLAIGLTCWVHWRTRHALAHQPCPTLLLAIVACISLWLIGSICLGPLTKYRVNRVGWNATELWSFWASATALKLIGLALAIGPVSWLLLDRWAVVRESTSPFAPMNLMSALDRTVYVRERALFLRNP